MKKLLIVILNYFSLTFTVAQIQLPAPDSLFASLRTYHDDKRAAELAQYRINEKYKYAKFAPSIGMTYDLQGRPRPSVSFSLNQMYQAANDNERNKAKMRNVELAALLEYRTDSLNLVAILRRIDVAAETMRHVEDRLKVEVEILQIIDAKFAANELQPLEYLERKRSFLAASEAIERKREEINLLKLEALKAAKR